MSYDSDLELVERGTIEVGRKVMQQVAGGVPYSEPSVRYNGVRRRQTSGPSSSAAP